VVSEDSEQAKETDSDYREFDCNFASFPSDSLSIKRLRALFPKEFDPPVRFDGSTGSDFFYPLDTEEPEQLVWLTEMLCDERIVAGSAYCKCFLDRHPELINDEDLVTIDHCRRRLEDNYQFFKLADSPETARLLIRQVEEEGEKQARSVQARGR
jgi:hypothetical protein